MDKIKQKGTQSTCPFQEGIAATHCWPGSSKARMNQTRLHIFVQATPSAPACSTQHQNVDNLQLVHDPSQGQGCYSPQGSGDRSVCHLAAFWLFLCVKIPSMCPQQKAPPLPLSSLMSLFRWAYNTKKQETSGPEEWTPSLDISMSHLGPRTSTVTGLTSIRWILIYQVGKIARKHSL